MKNCFGNLCRMNKKQKPQKLVVIKRPTEKGIESRYELGKRLDRGDFGRSTYFCKDRNTGEEVACKSISKNELKTALDIEGVRREVAILSHLPKHPNIVTLKDTFEDEDHVHLVMEHCEGGNLLDRIKARGPFTDGNLLDRINARGHFTELRAASVINTIVRVVQICHKHGVMHRNLKLENILFAIKYETAPSKVTDFSSSIFFKPGERFNEIVGSPYYMAPEVLKRNYGPEVDIWNAGAILYILLCGDAPFWAESKQGFAQAIIQSVIDFERYPWPKVSEKAKDLVMKMLDPDPKRRLTAQEVLDHPWLRKLVKKISNDTKCLVQKMLDPTLERSDYWLRHNHWEKQSLGETIRAKLIQFSVVNKLTKTTSTIIAKQLSIEVDAKSDRDFVIDTGNRGKINLDELRIRLHTLDHEIPDGNVQRLMVAFDEDKDGYLDYGEFLAICIHLRKISNEKHINKAFEYLDKNQSGYIDLEELCNALGDKVDTYREKVINEIMHDMDTYKDGIIISYEEVWS
ncbi:unnamed protein product [Vicia faba]|uniref:Calcium-dependent protein kinase n=1 Tax=Vicia faba TaxID=3906 RepID=A0AAV0ZUL8_VICFA|nr:unnamed protein product [Vicia faba]